MSVQIKGVGTIGGIDEGLNITGIVTATSFVGSGANLTSLPSQLTLANNADNRVITGGSGTNLNGEANLTWDGDSLDLTAGTGNQFPIQIRNDFTPNSQRADYASLLNATSNNTLRLGSINSNGGATIQVTRGNDSAQKHNLILQPDGGNIGINQLSPTTKLQITDTSATILRTEATANDGDALIQALGKDSSGNDRMIQMRTDAGADQYRIISSDTSYNLALCTGNAPRVLIAGNSAATSIGGSNTFNAMLTVQGDISGELLRLKATENTNRLMVSGSNTNGVEVNLYDDAGAQKGIMGVSSSECFVTAPASGEPLTLKGYSEVRTQNYHTNGSAGYLERWKVYQHGTSLQPTRHGDSVETKSGGRYYVLSGATPLDGSYNAGTMTPLMRCGHSFNGTMTLWMAFNGDNFHRGTRQMIYHCQGTYGYVGLHIKSQFNHNALGAGLNSLALHYQNSGSPNYYLQVNGTWASGQSDVPYILWSWTGHCSEYPYAL